MSVSRVQVYRIRGRSYVRVEDVVATLTTIAAHAGDNRVAGELRAAADAARTLPVEVVAAGLEAAASAATGAAAGTLRALAAGLRAGAVPDPRMN